MISLTFTLHLLVTSISFERLTYRDVDSFWTSFLSLATHGARRCGFQSSTPTISSDLSFESTFHATSWSHRFILLLDELSELYRAPPEVRDECLRAFRDVRNNNSEYAISSIVAAGTFSVVHFGTKNRNHLSPFNVFNHIQNPYFTLEETTILFRDFALDNSITIEDDVILDVGTKSNGRVT